MTRPSRLLLVGFLVVLAGGVALLAREMAPPPRRGSPPVARGPMPPAAPPVASSEPKPEPALPGLVGLEARVEGGGPVASLRVFVPRAPLQQQSGLDVGAGTRVGASYVGLFARAAGTAWERIPPPGHDGVARLVLHPAGAPLVLRVSEATGEPAAGVHVSYGALGAEGDAFRATDGEGRFTIDDALPGVLRVVVGGTERAGPTLRLVVGRDRDAVAVLEPALVVTGKVLAESGEPVPGARIHGLSPEGPCGADATSGADGSYRWSGRLTERLALVASADGFIDGAAKPPLPDPRGALSSTVEIRLTREVRGTRSVVLSGVAPERVSLFAEPAALAIARETFGPSDVLLGATEGEASDRAPGLYAFRGLDATVPVRVRIRGDVVPEDRLLAAFDPAWASGLVLRPLPAAPGAAPPAAAKPPAGPSTGVEGRITDASGRALAGVTVRGGGRTATTARDGTFRLEGLAPGESVAVVFGWIDGADPGDASPAEFAPWFEARIKASPTPVALVLPKAASASFRLLDGLDDHPLSWAHVVVSAGEGDARFDAAVATAGGRAALPSLVPGTAGTLSAFAPGYRRVVPLALRAGSVVDAGDVRLSHGGRATGTVKDRRGAPVRGASVALLDDERLESGAADAVRRADTLLRRATTDEGGAFVLEGLDPSRPASLGIWAPGYAPAGHRVPWGRPNEAELRATLSRGGRFVVRLVDGKGVPVSGAAIDLQDPRTGVRYLSLVHRALLGGSLGSTEDVRRATEALLVEDPKEPGVYRFGPIEPGPYDLLVEHPGHKPLRATFSVPDNEPSMVKGDPAEVAGAVPGRLQIGTLDWRVEMEPLTTDGH